MGDVAASLINFFSEVGIDARWTCVKGAPKGAFILTLDSSPSHFTIELGTKRNAVQLS
jgi:hypothetical protein